MGRGAKGKKAQKRNSRVKGRGTRKGERERRLDPRLPSSSCDQLISGRALARFPLPGLA